MINTKCYWLIVLGLSTVGSLSLAKDAKPEHKAEAVQGGALLDDKSKISYGIGLDMGKNFKRLALDIDVKQIMQGLQDGYAGNASKVPGDELTEIMSRFQNELKDKQKAAIKNVGAANKKAGEEFLANNAKLKDVISLPSGLQYKILHKGNGAIPTDNDWVECNYRGKLLDGTEFDSSYRTGKPSVFKVSGATPGWQEALKLMPAGSKWQLFIPSKLAYGENGAGRDIGPNATLIFEVELLNAHAGEGVPGMPSK